MNLSSNRNQTYERIIGRRKAVKSFLTLYGSIEKSGWTPAIWKDLHDQYVGGALSWPERLILVNPSWYERLLDRDQEKTIRGNAREFRETAEDRQVYRSCESDKYWGYSCPEDVDLQKDHVVPYWLGGPTWPSNRRFLCVPHHKMKSGDIHLIDLDEETLSWLDYVVTNLYLYLEKHWA